MKKIVIAGGTGFLGSCLLKYYSRKGYHVIILTRGVSRSEGNVGYLHWDGKNFGPWNDSLEGADAVINLNGKSVDCRYTKKNMDLIYSTRLDATRVLGEAILKCKNPPHVWINAASATIYRHSLGKEMDEETGEYGSGFSVDVCQKWEAVFNAFKLPATRKVIMRTGIVIGKDGGPLKPLKALARSGLGGYQGNGEQFFSWLHEEDFINIVDFFITHREMNGVYNVTAPQPVTNKQFMKTLRRSLRIPFGLPSPKWLLEIGAVIIRTETELILKSRRVIPKRLLEAGYGFRFGAIEEALKDLTR